MEFYSTGDGFVVKKEKEINIMDTEMDNYHNLLMSKEWSLPNDDFLDSIFSTDLLNELDGHDMNIQDFTTRDLIENERVPSGITTDTSIKDFNNYQEMDFNNINLTFPENQPMMISSNSSDSGLSSDNLELETSPDYEPLSPTLSSPGPSISERGGQNSPPRYINVNPKSKSKSIPKVIVEKINTNDGNLLFNNTHEYNFHPNVTKEVKIYRVPATTNSVVTANHKTQQLIETTNNGNALGKKVTIQLKQNGSGGSASGKLSNNKAIILNKNSANNLTGVKKLIRVQQNASNPRSILLPVSLQDVKDFRTIKIINTSNLKSKSPNIKMAAANLLQQSKQGLVQKNVLVSKDQLITSTSVAKMTTIPIASADDSFSDHTSDGESYVFEEVMKESDSVIAAVETTPDDIEYDDDEDCDESIDGMSSENGKNIGAGGYPKLVLTTEEKRLLAKEGITLPANYPLTKHEERELKRIRRKIRNKISAQDSRKRKKEYVDGLEERVKQCTEENQTLLKRIKLLQNQNHNLMSQMKKLQTLLTKGTGKTAQPATCLMVLLLSMVLVTVPNIKLGQSKDSDIVDAIQNTLSISNSQQNRRSLLFDTKDQIGDVVADEELNFDEIMSSFSSLNEHEFAEDSDVSAAVPPKKQKILVDFDVDDKIWSSTNSDQNNKKFNEHANQFHKKFTKNAIQSSGFNIGGNDISSDDTMDSIGSNNDSSEHKFDPDIIDLMTKNSDGGFELNMDKIATLSKQAFGDLNRIKLNNDIPVSNGGGSEFNKKNSSAQIKTRKMIQVKGV